MRPGSAADQARAVRRAAGRESTSAWLADVARRKLRAEGLMEVVREWEAQHGPLLDSALVAAVVLALLVSAG